MGEITPPRGDHALPVKRIDPVALKWTPSAPSVLVAVVRLWHEDKLRIRELVVLSLDSEEPGHPVCLAGCKKARLLRDLPPECSAVKVAVLLRLMLRLPVP